MNGSLHRRPCAEVVPHARHPRKCDAEDVAITTLQILSRFVERVALYVMPSGEVLRVSNPRLADVDMTPSFVGVYDSSAEVADIVADILAMEAA